ncbi:exonuclease SbcCD subunit D, partial [Candidatus Woesearchaeota archaeon]|nr:exonuclease SbcCD subunit D [Candidatus Woesearchaeota archaeon]
MKYAHLADSHLGSWRDPKMRELSTNAFLYTIDDCIKKQVDFILFAGDLFNTSLPALEILKTVTKKLKELQQANIPFYAIPGSHDFSPSGKTMLDVLENAGLLINVCKGTINPETKQLCLNFTTDPKTNTKITGMLGKRGMLDKKYYENLHLESLEAEAGYKIFLFHTTLSELKPKHLQQIESQPLSFLPKNFNYYAGGHIHHPTNVTQPHGTFTYPGALFPCNFGALEKYSHGSYYLIQVENNQQTITLVPIKIVDHIPIILDCSHKTPEVVAFDILDQLAEQDLTNTLITIRLTGTLATGKVSDIDFKRVFQQLYQQNAYFIMKNISWLQSKEFEEIKIDTSSPEQIEEKVIKEHLQQIKLFSEETEFDLAKNLLQTLNTNKKEGETIA